jgi:hypothetical protein
LPDPAQTLFASEPTTHGPSMTNATAAGATSPLVHAQFPVRCARQPEVRAYAPEEFSRMRRREVELRLDVTESGRGPLSVNELRFVDHRNDRARDEIPVIVQTKRHHRLNQERIGCIVVTTNVKVAIVLEGNPPASEYLSLQYNR